MRKKPEVRRNPGGRPRRPGGPIPRAPSFRVPPEDLAAFAAEAARRGVDDGPFARDCFLRGLRELLREAGG